MPYIDAIEQYRQALAINPKSWFAHTNLGNALAGCGQLEDAAAEYLKAVEIRPDFAVAHNNFANVLLTQGRNDEAIAEYRKAIALDSKYADACNNLGTVLAGRGELDAAVALFRRAVQIAPTSATAHGNLGMALSKQGKIEEAMDQWRERVRLQPNDPRAISQLAWAMATRPEPSIRNEKEAIELAEWAVTLSHGHEPVSLNTLAAAYAQAGRFSDALKTAQKALRLALQQQNQPLAESIRAKIALYRRTRRIWRQRTPCLLRGAPNTRRVVSLHFSPHRENRQQHVRWGRHFLSAISAAFFAADRNVCPTVV